MVSEQGQSSDFVRCVWLLQICDSVQCNSTILFCESMEDISSAFFNKNVSQLEGEHMHASVKHAQANEQVKATNKTILNGLENKMSPLQGKWTKELKNVLWVLRAMPKKAIEEKPFGMV